MKMQYTKSIDNKSLLKIIRKFCSYVDPRLTEHGAHVAYIVSRMIKDSKEYTEEERRNISFTAQFHDIGAYKTEEVSRMLDFETKDIWEHSFYGFLFLRYFSPLRDIAPAIFLHHTSWKLLEKENSLSPRLKDLAQLINIADRIDLSMSLRNLSWEKTLISLNAGKGTYYAPHILDLASQLDFKASIEEELKNDSEYQEFLDRVSFSPEEITDYLKMLVFIIDFRSHYTVTHTIATVSISYELGKLLHLKKEQLNNILCGSLLHDLGKIAIPIEILESPGKLSDREMDIMKTHVDLTEKIFSGSIDETIARISLRHHEKLDGSGYPKGLTAKDLTVEERIVAVADIISALTGVRSYKESFPQEKIIAILTDMKNFRLLDENIVSLACDRLSKILDTTAVRCQPVIDIYEKLNQEYRQFLAQDGFSSKLQVVLSIRRQEKKVLWP